MRRRDHYGDGVWYDAEYVHIRGDVAYYQRVAQETDGFVLELACGTGRLTIPMAEAGAYVHGVDNAPAMIEQARVKQAGLPAEVQDRLRFDLEDMRTMRLGRTYASVVLGFNTLMHMTDDDDLMACLETARAHLAPDGRFHLDLYTPFAETTEVRDPDGRYDPEEMIDPRTGARYVVTDNYEYDARQQIKRMWFFYQEVDGEGRPVGEEAVTELALRVIYPRELDAFLRWAGLELVGDWGDFERRKPFDGRDGRRVLVARARP